MIYLYFAMRYMQSQRLPLFYFLIAKRAAYPGSPLKARYS